MIKNFIVLGGGSAGLLAALAIQRNIEGARVRIVFSPDIGIIGVGESTTPNVPNFLSKTLGLSARSFYQIAEPTWKLGVKFFWGPRRQFNYPFKLQLDRKLPGPTKPLGYYCDDDFPPMNLDSALMDHERAFVRQPTSSEPMLPDGPAFHLENKKFVKALETAARERGLEFIEGKLKGAERGSAGIAAIILEDGRRLDADFFVDASGFRSELLGRELKVPYLSFDRSLFNDRCILASWERSDDEIIHPYTTAETMDAGWAWRIDHEKIINRGYVYCSHFVSEEAAREEFARKNPKATVNERLIQFKTGRYQQSWVDNVLAVGNSTGFAEPLEATALMSICWQCDTFLAVLGDLGSGPRAREFYNGVYGLFWDEVRDFLAIHFKFNTRIDTPYWQHCRADTDVSNIDDLIDLYHEVGPSGFNRYNVKNRLTQFGIDGYLNMLVGNQVPFKRNETLNDSDIATVKSWQTHLAARASTGYTVKEALELIRRPDWNWSN